MDSHGVWQLTGVMCCVAYCTLGLYITTYNVRTEMSALKVQTSPSFLAVFYIGRDNLLLE